MTTNMEKNYENTGESFITMLGDYLSKFMDHVASRLLLGSLARQG